MKKKNKKKNTGSRSIENEQKYLLTHKSDFFLREAYKTMRTNVTFALTEEKPTAVYAYCDKHGLYMTEL